MGILYVINTEVISGRKNYMVDNFNTGAGDLIGVQCGS